MKIVKPVMFSIMLSALCLPGILPQAGTPGVGQREPGGPLDAGAALVRVIEDGAYLRALVRLELLASSEDLDATVSAAGQPRGRAVGQTISRAALTKGKPQTMLFESDLEPNRENHLFYRVEGKNRSGVRTDTIVYLRVNLDPALEPEEVDGYLVFQGAPGTEVSQ